MCCDSICIMTWIRLSRPFHNALGGGGEGVCVAATPPLGGLDVVPM